MHFGQSLQDRTHVERSSWTDGIQRPCTGKAYNGESPVGVIVCKQDVHRGKLNRGYIAMLSTKPEYRKLGIATALVERAIDRMKRDGAQEVSGACCKRRKIPSG